MKKKILTTILILFISLIALTGCDFTYEAASTTEGNTATEPSIDYSSIASDIYSQVYSEIEDSLYSQIYSEIKSEFIDGNIDTDSLQQMIKETVAKSQATNVYVLNYTKQNNVDTAEASGSGVVFLKETGENKAYRYYVITNHHVIEDGSKQTIQYGDDAPIIECTLVGSDENTDIALLYFESDIIYATATLGDSDKVEVGDIVLACGNPKGITLYNSITMGIVGGTGRHLLDDDGSVNTRNSYIQHDAAINGGNSGGGLFNLDGELIGINSVKYASSEIEGLNFSIPVNLVKEVIYEIKEYGSYSGNVSLGITCTEVTSLNEYGRSTYSVPSNVTTGILVIEVSETGSCNGVLEANDIIVGFDGTTITSTSQLGTFLNSHRVGDTVTLTIIRGGTQMDVEVTFIRTR